MAAGEPERAHPQTGAVGLKAFNVWLLAMANGLACTLATTWHPYPPRWCSPAAWRLHSNALDTIMRSSTLKRSTSRSPLSSLQLDGSSCGLFTCAYAELLARGEAPRDFAFSQVRPSTGMSGYEARMTRP